MDIKDIIGFICGTAIILLLIWTFIRRRNNYKISYDERQLAIRGVGYMKAFYSLTLWLAIIVIAGVMEISIPASNTVLCFTGILLSCLILAWHCIMNDAYWGIKQKNKYYVYVLAVLGFINLLVGGNALVSGQSIENGILQNDFIVFETGIFVLCLGMFLMIKHYEDNKEK